MSQANGRENITINAGASTRSRPVTVDPEQARVGGLCRERGLKPPVLDHAGFTACWPDADVALLVVGRSLKQTLRRANRAALDGWFLVLATEADWQSGKALDAVKRAVSAVS